MNTKQRKARLKHLHGLAEHVAQKQAEEQRQREERHAARLAAEAEAKRLAAEAEAERIRLRDTPQSVVYDAW